MFPQSVPGERDGPCGFRGRDAMAPVMGWLLSPSLVDINRHRLYISDMMWISGPYLGLAS